MAGNALTGLTTPAAPQMPQQQPQAGASPAGPPPGAPQQQPQQPPAPTHAQAVAGLRHYDAIVRVLEGLLKDPALGKTDMKSKFIDGMKRLVADRIMSPAEAVTQLGSVPTDPVEQLKWTRAHFGNALMAENAILDHHRAAFPGGDNSATPADPDNHMQDMQGLMGHYGKSSAPVVAAPSPKLKNALKAA